MLLDPGVVGGALDGDVQGQFHAVGADGGYEVVEVGEGAELGMDGLMAAFRRADRPGAAGVAGIGGRSVVGAFAEGGADGVDGRQVKDVEAHAGDLGEQRLDVGEGAVAGGIGRRRTREELVPTGEAGALAIDPEAELFGVGGKGEVGIAGGKLFDLGREGVLVEGELLAGQCAQRSGDGLEAIDVDGLRFLAAGAGAGCGLVEELRANLEGDGNVLRRKIAPGGVGAGGVGLGGEALFEVVAPSVEVVDPGLDGVGPGAELFDGEAGGPQVVDERGHGRGAPLAFALMLEEEARGDVVVAVREDGGGDRDLISNDAAYGVAATIDLGLDGFDDDSLTAFFGFHLVRFTNSGCGWFARISKTAHWLLGATWCILPKSCCFWLPGVRPRGIQKEAARQRLPSAADPAQTMERGYGPRQDGPRAGQRDASPAAWRSD